MYAPLTAFRAPNVLVPLLRLVRPREGRLRVFLCLPVFAGALSLESELGEGWLPWCVQCFFGNVCAFSGRFDGENLDAIFDLW